MEAIGFACRVKHGEVRCVGLLQPTAYSQCYQVEIILRAGSRPSAQVISPKLEPRGPDEPIPHTWAPNEPCFYFPAGRDWTPSMALAYSVVPWLGLWLVHYEGWRVTGKWEGGGVKHGPRDARGEASEAVN